MSLSPLISASITAISSIIFVHSIYSSYEYRLTSPTASLPLEISIPLLLSAAALLVALLFNGRWKLREVEAGKAYGETVRRGGKTPGFETLEGGWVDVVKDKKIVDEYRAALQAGSS